MKLIEADERYVFDCCQYTINVDNGEAVVTTDKGGLGWWPYLLDFIPFVGDSMRLDAKFCPECGAKIPNVKEDNEVKEYEKLIKDFRDDPDPEYRGLRGSDFNGRGVE